MTPVGAGAGLARSGRRRLAALTLAMAAPAFGTAACQPFSRSWEAGSREAVPIRVKKGATLPAGPAPIQLKVMAWNIKYGAARVDFWFDDWGDRVQMTRAEVEGNMAAIYALINEVRPDILLTEEIEVNSRRSAYVDMVQGILEHTDLGWAAYVPTWQSQWIPSEGVGQMDLGNALFSRYPLRQAERIAQIDRTDQDAATRYFYIHRAVGRAVIDAGRDVVAMVVHPEAYDKDGTKARQLVQIKALMDAEPGPFVIGGDFNALPPGSVERVHFNDESPKSAGTEFEQPPYPPDEMVPFYAAYLPHIPSVRYGTSIEEQKRFYTHSVIGRSHIGARGEPGFWTRQLDYLFVKAPSAWGTASTDNLQEPGRLGISSDPLDLSDHCPVVGGWEIGP